MANYDIFNGDADGICSLVQLRLANPQNSTLVTGVKRDIELVVKVKPKPGDYLTVLDLSLEKNAEAVKMALEAGATVFYADHHRSGDIPDHTNFSAYINTQPNTCTGLIVDYHLNGQYREWAIVAAYGDNITQVGDEYCAQLKLSSDQQSQLRQLGIAMNYNGYGSSLGDLFFHPEELYRMAVKYRSPFDFIAAENAVIARLTTGYKEDIAKGLNVKPDHETETAALLILPDERWSRRVSGVLGNELTNQHPDRAHIILTPEHSEVSTDQLTYQVSIRAPKHAPHSADKVAVSYGGGGRSRAAGISGLAFKTVDVLWQQVLATYSTKQA